MLKVEGLKAGYGASTVLFGIDLQIQTGQVVSLLGRNGMGKSTLIRCVLGLLPVQSGAIFFDNQNLLSLSPDRIARAGLAIVPEGRQCFPNLTVHEHLTAFQAYRNGKSSDCWNARRVYAMFPRLAERAKHMGNQLSGGEQQMLAIGRALVTNPKLLILDEATEGLAPKIREEIWSCLAQLRAEGQTVLVVDKYIDRLMGLADRHIIVEKGCVAWEGTSELLAGSPQLWANYLGI